MRLSLSIFIGIGGGRAASWVVYEVRALHGTSPHPARLRGSPAGPFAHLPHPFVCGFVASLPDARAVPSNPEPGCRADHGAAPAILGLSNEEIPSHVHEPSGISVRILVEGSPGAHRRTGREGHPKRPCGRFHVSGASRTRECRNHAPTGRHARADKTARVPLNSCRLDRTRCPQRTVPAPATISGALPSSSCNFAGVSQR